MKRFVVYPLALLLSACANLATKSYDLSQELANLTNSNSLACRFEKQTTGQNTSSKSSWFFWRQPTRTETRDELSNQGEIWEKNQSGQLFYTRLFFNERVALEFVPGDLAAMDTAPSWQQLRTIIDTSTLGKSLALVNQNQSGKLTIESYTGTVNNVATEVEWLPALQLPARVLKKLPEGTVTLTLTECGDEAKLAVKPITKAEFDKLRHLDYTDFGDMEEDPMVRHLEQLMGGHHHDH